MDFQFKSNNIQLGNKNQTVSDSGSPTPPSDFDWIQYRKNYPDLQNSHLKTRDDFVRHWVLHGQKEGRDYKSSSAGFSDNLFGQFSNQTATRITNNFGELSLAPINYNVESQVYKHLFSTLFLVFQDQRQDSRLNQMTRLFKKLKLPFFIVKKATKTSSQQNNLNVRHYNVASALDWVYRNTNYGFVYIAFDTQHSDTPNFYQPDVNHLNYDYYPIGTTLNFIVNRKAIEYLLANLNLSSRSWNLPPLSPKKTPLSPKKTPLSPKKTPLHSSFSPNIDIELDLPNLIEETSEESPIEIPVEIPIDIPIEIPVEIAVEIESHVSVPPEQQIELVVKVQEKMSELQQIELILKNYQISTPTTHPHQRPNIYVSLTTTPTRCGDPDFYRVIDSLLDQNLTPTRIFVSVSQTYRKFPDTNHELWLEQIAKLKEYSPLIEVIECDDLGPILKVIGVINRNSQINFLKTEDIVVCVDDDAIYHQNLTLWHYNIYQTFDLGGVGVNELNVQQYDPELIFANKASLYDDFYENYFYGWLSYSFKWKSLAKFKTFYSELSTKIPDLFNYDDAVMTAFAKSQCLQLGSINTLTVDKCIHYCDFTADVNQSEARKAIEMEISRFIGINLNPFKNVASCPTERLQPLIPIIPKCVPANEILIASNIEIEAKVGSTGSNVFIFVPRYYDTYHFELVITRLDQTGYQENGWTSDLELKIVINHNQGQSIIHYHVGPSHHYRIVRIIQTGYPVLYLKNQISPIPKVIVQTFETNNISLQRYLSMRSIIEMNPNHDYEFYNARDRKKFLIQFFNQQLVTAYSLLQVKKYRADLFKYAYLYLRGGISIDCKMVALNPVSIALTEAIKKLYVFDDVSNLTGTNLIISQGKNENLEEVMRLIIKNVLNRHYGTDALDVTGSRILHQVVGVKGLSPQKTQKCILQSEGQVKDKQSGRPLFACSYPSYYSESDYSKVGHASLMWKAHKVFDHLSHKSKDILSSKLESLIKLETSTSEESVELMSSIADEPSEN
jgi:hypothetical protein